MPKIAGDCKSRTTQLRASPIVLGITPGQLRGLDAANVALAYRIAATRLRELADELDGGAK